MKRDVGRLCLGTAQWSGAYGVSNQYGTVSYADARAILDVAQNHGIHVVDTAVAYGDAEKKLGELGVAHWQVVTKLPKLPSECPSTEEWVIEETRASIERLQVPSLHALLVHTPNDLLSPAGADLYRALCLLRDSGMVESIGFSLSEWSELELLSTYAIDVLQAPFNIVDRRLDESGWLRKLAESGVEVHVRSVFLQGLLLMSQPAMPAFFHRWGNLWSAWHEWLDEMNLTPVEACLGFALSRQEVSRIVVGVERADQLQQIIDSVGAFTALTPPEISVDDLDLLDPSRWDLS